MNLENKPTQNKLHSLTLQNRTGAQLEGVFEVIRFDENEAIFDTVCGTLSIDGEGLHLSEWNTERGSATLEGASVVSAVWYSVLLVLRQTSIRL